MSSKPIYLRALEGLRRREGLFRVLIFTLVTVFFWIGFNIYQSQTKTKISIDIRKHTEPLNPNINREVLQELATRRKYTPEELQEFPLYERVVDDNGVSQLIIAGTSPIPVERVVATPETTPVLTETGTATESTTVTSTPIQASSSATPTPNP